MGFKKLDFIGWGIGLIGIAFGIADNFTTMWILIGVMWICVAIARILPQ